MFMYANPYFGYFDRKRGDEIDLNNCHNGCGFDFVTYIIRVCVSTKQFSLMNSLALVMTCSKRFSEECVVTADLSIVKWLIDSKSTCRCCLFE